MKINCSLNSAAVNKTIAIRFHQNAIKNARDFLAIDGKSDCYYDWHRRTIEENEKAIKAIINDLDTNWN